MEDEEQFVAMCSHRDDGSGQREHSSLQAGNSKEPQKPSRCGHGRPGVADSHRRGFFSVGQQGRPLFVAIPRAEMDTYNFAAQQNQQWS